MKFNKGIFALVGLIALTTTGCGSSKEKVFMYTSTYDYHAALIEQRIEEHFPNIDVQIQLMSSANIADRLLSEGKKSNCDIFFDLEVANAEMILAEHPDAFCDLSEYDTSKYLDNVLGHETRHKKYNIFAKEAECIVVNNKVLKDKGLKKPTSYNDLLDPSYKGLIMMPNPKTSCGGWCFYKNFIEEWGLDATLDYFTKLYPNIKEYSTSGSAPTKALDREEIAVGFGVTYVTAKYIDNNPDLEIIYFDEGSPYSLFTMGIVNGKEQRKCVKDAYDYFFNVVNFESNAKYVPAEIYKPEFAKDVELAGYPKDVKYANMGDLYDFEYKKELLDKWKW